MEDNEGPEKRQTEAEWAMELLGMNIMFSQLTAQQRSQKITMAEFEERKSRLVMHQPMSATPA